jgi:uncharacterized protein YutE (UPF0331/DUF86 family)
VARDVLLRKLLYLRQLLADLEPYRRATLADVEREHYKIERLFELLVMAASDIVFHLLQERDLAPTSYRDGFRLSGEEGLLPSDLAIRLQSAAGMRNILVHLYEEIDHTILHQSIPAYLNDFAQFVTHFESQMDEDSSV